MYSYDDYYELGMIKFINDDIINYINYQISLGKPIRITFENTKILNSEVLSKITNTDLLQVRVLGGLDKEKYNSKSYMKRATYSLNDMRHIMRIFERIESTVDPKWSDMEKATHIYNTLANYMSYEYNYRNSDMDVCQSLRALIDGKGICAGYALIYKELMDRQGIQCDYVRGVAVQNGDSGKHAWNVVVIDGVNYPIDVTWESGAIHEDPFHRNHMEYFGLSEEFVSSHTPEADERITDYKAELYKAREKVNAQKNTRIESKFFQRDDGSYFCLAEIPSDNKGLHQYMQCELNSDGYLGKTNVITTENDIMALDFKNFNLVVNSLLDKNRIEKYCNNGANGYVGYIASDQRKYFNQHVPPMLKENKNYVRSDGTNLTLMKESEQPFERNGVSTYKCCEFVVNSSGQVEAVVDRIHSETDISMNSNSQYDSFFATYSLARDRIDRKVSSGAGYVGTVSVKDCRLVKYEVISTAETIQQYQRFNTSDLRDSRFCQVSKNDYRFISGSFGYQQEQNIGYSRGFVSYKILLTYAFVICAIGLLLYLIISLFL